LISDRKIWISNIDSHPPNKEEENLN
jgi:hypothetical protein